MNQSNIRNFAIIAHIDHGKSTLADRLLELTGTVEKRNMQEQILDSNPIERERGITIKLAPVRMSYSTNNQTYILNLIDTPGHVDFSYEVSRSLAACEGAILVVDSTQGVQAQTLANLHLARQHKLKIVPVINKIDLLNAKIEETEKELIELGFTKEEFLHISAKTGLHVDDVLHEVIDRIPAPKGDQGANLRALVFSSQYDVHKGVVVFVRVVDGSLEYNPKINIRFIASGINVHPISLGYFSPQPTTSEALATGEVGFIATGLKNIQVAKVGDTITAEITNDKFQMSNIKPLPGYKEPKPMVFVGLFPVSSDDFTDAREAVEKLRLSDSAFTFKPIATLALGNGFHCGFLGLLHAEIVQERLLREFDMTMIATSPSVEYKLKRKDNKGKKEADEEGFVSIQSAAEFPDPTMVEEIREPIMEVRIFTPKKYIGSIMQLAQEKRGEYIDLKYIGEQAEFTYLIPLSEMIVDFFDRLKSISEGYASLDYEFFEYQQVDLAKVDILVNHEKVDALSILIPKMSAERTGRIIAEKLAQAIPRAQFTIPIQASIGGKVIARADVKSFRKDVIQKLYGGDRSRKDKLLDKQKKGKAKMKMIGRVEIPQTAFFEVLKRN